MRRRQIVIAVENHGGEPWQDGVDAGAGCSFDVAVAEL